MTDEIEQREGEPYTSYLRRKYQLGKHTPPLPEEPELDVSSKPPDLGPATPLRWPSEAGAHTELDAE